MDMRICRRAMPFNDHRNFAEVLETEDLERRLQAGKLVRGEWTHLQRLQMRATEPDREPPPDAA